MTPLLDQIASQTAISQVGFRISVKKSVVVGSAVVEDDLLVQAVNGIVLSTLDTNLATS